jgi:hypothetical protein
VSVVPIWYEGGWAPIPVWKRRWREKFPARTGTRTPDYPACSLELYHWAIPARNRKYSASIFIISCFHNFVTYCTPWDLSETDHSCLKWEKLSPTTHTHKRAREGVSKSFRTGRLERELQMVQLAATRCNCIAILWVSIVSFVAITLCIAPQRVFIIVIYFVVDSLRKLLDTPSRVRVCVRETLMVR